MTKVTDEMLMALADGELDQGTAAQVMRAADTDPVLAKRLAEFQRTRILAKQAFAEALEERVPERLLAAASPRQRRWSVSSDWRRAWLPAGIAVAASVAGFFVALAVSEAPNAPWLPPEREIATALDKAASGEKVTLAGGDSVEPTATYTVPEGVCRSFRVIGRSADAASWLGVACRHAGTWQVEMAVAERALGSEFVPASDRATQSLDTFLEAAGAGDSLDGPAEERLRENGWQSK